MRAAISLPISLVSIAGSMRRWMREDPVELAQVGLDRRLHVGILQLAGQLVALVRAGAVDLAERGGGGRLVLELGELALPVGPELRHHAPLDEGPAHRRGVALQLGELGGVFGRQRVGNGRHHLGDLHDRALQAAERRRELDRVLAAVEPDAEEARRRDLRRDAAHIGADARIARGTGGETVFFPVGHSGSLSMPLPTDRACVDRTPMGARCGQVNG